MCRRQHSAAPKPRKKPSGYVLLKTLQTGNFKVSKRKNRVKRFYAQVLKKRANF
jgi:hypothetical protein